MRLQKLLTVGLLALSFTATSAVADDADKAKKQAEIRGHRHLMVVSFD
jgi:hypothetical protein